MNKQKWITYINNFHGSSENGLHFIEHHLIEDAKEEDIEHILDFVCSQRKTYKSLGYKTILEKSNAWSKKLQAKASAKHNEKEGVDYETIFKVRSYRFVKLLSKKAYEREGKLMSHCVSSYYGKADEIYSLRDSKNRPHCTISKSSGQVKGKGNGSIHPKYIESVVEFLKHFDITPSDNDMKNMGYVDVSDIKSVLFPKESMLGDKWFFKSDFHKIVDKDHVELIKINGGIFGKDFKEVIDLEKAIENIMYSSGLDYSTVSARDHSTVSGRNYSTVSARDHSTASGLDSSTVSARDYSAVSARNYSTVSGRNYSTVSGRDYSTVSARDHSTASGGQGAMITARHESRAKGGLGSVITLCECNTLGQIIAFDCIQIDGKKYTEDTWYVMKDGKIVEESK